MAGRDVSTGDIEQLMLRLKGLASKVLPDAQEWDLRMGDPEVVPRAPWLVVDQHGDTVLHLGYTKREALSALLAMASVLAVTFGA